VMGFTHAAGGAFLGAAAGVLGGDPLAGMAVGAVAALLPDIDHPGSLAGRRVPLLPYVLSALAGHRGITHTVWFCLGVAFLTGFLAVGFRGWDQAHLAAYALLGALSHLALDGLTPSGVSPFAPLVLPGKLARLNHVSGPVATGTVVVEGPLSFLLLVLALKLAGVF